MTDTDLASVSSLDDPLRRRLYEVVARRTEPVCRDEAAAAAGIGRALAVYHLDKLVEAGLLEATYARPAGRTGPGAGRPAKLYARSDREFAVTVPPREYELAGALTRHGYEPRRDEAGTIRLRNCPFHQLAEQHRDIVCGMNLGLIEGLVAGLEVPEARPALDPSRGHCCVAIGAEQP